MPQAPEMAEVDRSLKFGLSYEEFIDLNPNYDKGKKYWQGRAWALRKAGEKIPYEAELRGLKRGHGTTGAPSPFFSDKKIGEVSWEEWADHLLKSQELNHKASFSQDFATIEFPDIDRPICVLPISDLHIGSWGTDYRQWVELTKEIVETPDLYIALVGDLAQMAIKLRNVLEVSDNMIPPERQADIVEAWLAHISPKVLFATWDNHAVMREENVTGMSVFARMLKRRVVYFSGIGQVDIRVGEHTYKIAVSHRFRGSSYMNATHAQARYMRFEGQDREIAIQGDTHTPAYQVYYDGPMERLAINCGTLQTNSGYARRFFSLWTQTVFPCFSLDPHKHEVLAFKSVAHWRGDKPTLN